jgi:hypothetical protein
MNSTTYSPLTLRAPYKLQTKFYVNKSLEVPAMFTVQYLPWGVDGYLPYFLENYNVKLEFRVLGIVTVHTEYRF